VEAEVKLGILITDHRYKDFIAPVLKAAIDRGDQVQVFIMDDGCLLADAPDLKEVFSHVRLSAVICDLNRMQRGIEAPLEVSMGSQYDNAKMMHESDKVLVF
jgi:hypothetical protein